MTKPVATAELSDTQLDSISGGCYRRCDEDYECRPRHCDDDYECRPKNYCDDDYESEHCYRPRHCRPRPCHRDWE